MSYASDTIPRCDEHFLKDVANIWLGRLADADARLLRSFLEVQMSWGSGCSGLETAGFCFDGLGAALDMAAFVHIFSCEIDTTCLKWISRVSSPKYLFQNVSCLGNSVAEDVRRRDMVPVHTVGVFAAGFVCKDLSCENGNQNLDAVSQGCGSSGSTFRGVIAFVQAHLPRIVILENVAGVKNSIPYIRGELERYGYAVAVYELDAQLFFVPQARIRVYFAAIHRGTQQQMDKLAETISLFSSGNQRPGVSSFLMKESHPRLGRAFQKLLAAYHRGEVRRQTKRTKWKREHAAQSIVAGTIASFHMDDALVQTYPGLLAMSSREQDLLAVQGIVFPEEHRRFIKISSSCNRFNVPSTEVVPTMTTRSRFYITDVCRLMTGLECLHMQGLFPSDAVVADFDDVFLLESAGNAFAAPVFLCVLMAGLVASATACTSDCLTKTAPASVLRNS